MYDIVEQNCDNTEDTIICYTSVDSEEPVITENITVNNTKDSQGFTDTDTILTGVNNISAYSEHLEFVVSPKILSGKDKHVVLRLSQKFLDSLGNIINTGNVNNLEGDYNT